MTDPLGDLLMPGIIISSYKGKHIPYFATVAAARAAVDAASKETKVTYFGYPYEGKRSLGKREFVEILCDIMKKNTEYF